MDAASLALGIVTLYTTCRDCYNFFTTVKTAEAESSAHLRELEIQQSILKAWGFHWQIQNEETIGVGTSGLTEPKRIKLHEYLSNNRYKAEGVFKTLSALADTLSNQRKLIERYGIQFKPSQTFRDALPSTDNVQLTLSETTIEEVGPVIVEIRSRLSVLNKFKWALKDKESFKKLVAELRSHSDSLYRLCPENALVPMNIYLTLECLAKEESSAGLMSTSRLATQQAQVNGDISVRQGYELLASAATFKASVNENRGGERPIDGNIPSVHEEQREMRYLGKGLALFGDQVVYVEMRDYRGPPLELTAEQKRKIKRRRKRPFSLKPRPVDDTTAHLHPKAYVDQTYRPYSSGESEEDDEPIELIRPADPKLRSLIWNFFNTFQGMNMRESVYGLDIAGMIDHTEGDHKGYCSILYKLPGTIGIPSRERPVENLKLRAPVTLESLLGNDKEPDIQSNLGKRFELARKLVRAVCLLHSGGWLHKNIRAESVMFFPEHVSALHVDLYEIKIGIDVSKPILMGYLFSRPDDIIDRTNSSKPHIAAQPAQRIATESFGTSVWDSSHAGPVLTPQDGRNVPKKRPRAKEMKDINISGFTLDYYQHPAKHADLKRSYCHAYDVYSLGILLLEVGLWTKLGIYEETGRQHNEETRPRRNSYDEEDHYERRRWICREYLDRLRWACGDTYADVVLSCLMIDSSDDEMGQASERELCARIVANLEGCRA